VTTEANADSNETATDAASTQEVSSAAEPDSTAVEPEPTAAERDVTVADEPERTRRFGAGRTAVRGARKRIGATVLTLVLLASAGIAAWLYFVQYGADQQTDAAARQVALDAATTGTVALLSYSPDTLDKDFAAAKERLTGDFLNYYTQFTQQIVTPAAKEKQVKTSAAVVQAAVSKIEPSSAEVLVFVNQNTTSKENPDGAFAASAVKVGLTKVDGHWLINAFDPV
jgi:Mce-associated membrane protein